MRLIEAYEPLPLGEYKYGEDAFGNDLEAPDGYTIIEKGDDLREGDRPFDIHSGWLGDGVFNPRYHHQAYSEGRWTTWARPSK